MDSLPTRLVIALLICSVLMFSSAAAQEITGTITGTVVDQSGAAMPGVTVTVRNLGTNATQAIVTDASGVYVFPLLQTGRYEVDANFRGSASSSARTSI